MDADNRGENEEQPKKVTPEITNKIPYLQQDFNVRNYLNTEKMTEKQVDRCEFWVSAHRKVKQSGKCNFQGERIVVNDRLNFEYMEEKLENYPDIEVINYLKYGWPLNDQNTEINEEIPPNQKGVHAHHNEVCEYLYRELENGSVIGPFHTNLFGDESCFSPLDTRPKKGTDEVRIILNLSHPFKSGSVNASIDGEKYMGKDMNLWYPTPEDLARIIKRKGKKCKVFIRDLKKAYRQLFLDPLSIPKVGYFFENEIWFDVTLSMGSKSSAYCCQKTSNCITYMFKQEGFENVNYLDDLGGAEVEEKAEEAFTCLGNILRNCGIWESTSKCTPPSEIATFLGILYNTIAMTMEMTPEHLNKLKQLLNEWLDKEQATLREVQQILGKLSFACSTVRSGRVFVSKIINMLKGYPTSGKRRLSSDFKRNIKWWHSYMQDFDEISLFPSFDWGKLDEIMSTDSCLTGCGGWSSGDYFHSKFPEWLTNLPEISINELETMAVIVAVKIWSHKLANSHTLLFCDNQATCDIINTGRACNQFTQECLREICFLTAKVIFWSGVGQQDT